MSKIKTSTNEYKVYMQYDVEEIDGDIIYTGDTTCKILLNNELVAFGHSSCNVGDQFVKSIGRKIALTRALKQLKLEREDRLEFWKKLFPQYFRS